MYVDARFIINALVNNTFNESVCFVCLMELDECKESIYTKVCKEDMEYCLADILSIVFKIQISDEDDYNICPDCFIGAFSMYKFYLQVLRSQEVLNFYSDALNSQIDVLEENAESFKNIVCVEIPEFEPEIKEFNIDIGAFASQYVINNDNNTVINMNEEDNTLEKTTYEVSEKQQLNDLKLSIKKEMEDNIIVVTDDKRQSTFYEINGDGDFVQIEQIKQGFETDSEQTTKSKKHDITKNRKQRSPMDYVSCNKCPVKYRFLSKLKTHMKQEHNTELFICKVCKIMLYDVNDYHNHLNHHNKYVCGICGKGITKRSGLIAHLKRHEQPKVTPPDSDICEVCGESVPKANLKEHYSKKHHKKYICFYCGKAYKVETSLETHIKKHESYHSSYKCGECSLVFDSLEVCDQHVIEAHPEKGIECTKCGDRFPSTRALKLHDKIHNNFHCDECSKSFVDARALMWHQRLHTGERPYACQTCGRTFISANRRNQHAVCAHSEPTRRCPLCPGLFHLRSMVNSHIRKVHLKDDQLRHQRTPRWNRSVKYRDVFWRTEVVPLDQLSVAVQSELLQMQTNGQE